MKFRSFDGGGEEEPGLPLTPLIDIIFLLLIFYISIGRIQQVESQIALTLPTARSAESPQQSIGDVIINVETDGSITVNNQAMNLETLETRLKRLAEVFPGQSVIIRSDGEASWNEVCRVLDVCSVADIWNIKFAVLPEEEATR